VRQGRLKDSFRQWSKKTTNTFATENLEAAAYYRDENDWLRMNSAILTITEPGGIKLVL